MAVQNPEVSEEARSDLVVIEDKGDYALMRINRPEKRNAMSRAMRLAMLAAMDQVRGKYKVVVLTGTDKSFCSGIDLKESHADREEGRGEDPKSDWNEVNIAIRRHPSIFIAAVNGIALGGGSTLINVCDLAIAANEAEIGMPEMGFATYPGLAGPAMQIALPRKRAAYMILTARRVGGQQAKEWGMVNEAVPLDDLLDAADALARHVAQFDGAALTESKRAIDYIPNVVSDWRQAFDYGQKVNALIRSRTKGASEGLARFSAGQRNPGQG